MRRESPIFFIFIICMISGWTAEKFDWSQILAIPPGNNQTFGNQILHFKSLNKPFWENEKAQLFVDQYLLEAAALSSDAEVLKYGSDHVEIKGYFIELGVCTGKTINFIAALNPHQKVYGFDSFEGLPEDWVRGDKIISAGTFAFKNPDIFPPVLHNVHLIKGWFEDTLGEFVQASDPSQPISFLHVDCDIYSSAATAFEILESKICAGTIIVFDELYNYPGSENHEFKAFCEFLERTGLKAKYLAYNIYHEQVAIQIVE
ncbi:MAG: class I SAM-dependent methyltransferase [Parachlamydiales bacterium]|nr:class I SAM-dependent methyltransferase [Parachlamydiales bacterium]